jgi:cell division protein FtsA
MEESHNEEIKHLFSINSNSISLTSALFKATNTDKSIISLDENLDIKILFHQKIDTPTNISGIPSHFDIFKNKIEILVENAQQATRYKIAEATVLLSSGHFLYQSFSEKVELKSGIVRETDIKKLVQQALSTKHSKPYHLGFFYPCFFSLDHFQKIDNPVGLIGKHLTLNGMTVNLDSDVANNLTEAFSNTQIHLNEFLCKGLVSSIETTSSDERNLGIVSVYMGHRTTVVSVHMGLLPVFQKCYSFGGNHLTNDLFVGLRTPMSSAENLKKEIGNLCYLTNELSHAVEIESSHGQGYALSSKGRIQQILMPRFQEMMEIIKADLKNMKLLHRLNCGMVLTGGGARLQGATQFAEIQTGLSCRLGYPKSFSGLKEGLTNTNSTSIIGAFRLQKMMENHQAKQKEVEIDSGWFGALKSRMAELFQ